jgi:hypothetical protein
MTVTSSIVCGRAHPYIMSLKPCGRRGVAPIEASGGKTIRHRLNRGGNRALHVICVVRLRRHQPTRDYVARRTAEGKTKAETIRCLKRYIAREIYRAIQQPSPTTIAPRSICYPVPSFTIAAALAIRSLGLELFRAAKCEEIRRKACHATPDPTSVSFPRYSHALRHLRCSQLAP